MENPFEILNSRIQHLEDMLSALTTLVQSSSLPQQQQPITYDRRKPATREIAAEYLGVSMGTVDNLVRSKQLKVCKVGNAVRFRWEALDEFIQRRSK